MTIADENRDQNKPEEEQLSKTNKKKREKRASESCDKNTSEEEKSRLFFRLCSCCLLLFKSYPTFRSCKRKDAQMGQQIIINTSIASEEGLLRKVFLLVLRSSQIQHEQVASLGIELPMCLTLEPNASLQGFQFIEMYFLMKA